MADLVVGGRVYDVGGGGVFVLAEMLLVELAVGGRVDDTGGGGVSVLAEI